MLADVSAKIADVNTNILDIEARTDEQRRGWITVTVEISDMKHLEKVMKSLRGIPGVRLGGPGAGGAAGSVAGRPGAGYRIAMTSISTRTSRGRRATWMVVRAGAGAAKYSP